jgi:N-acetylglutamate synthase-like GNAT family acetyltransferase
MIMLKTAEREDLLDVQRLIEREGLTVPAGFPEGMEVVVARDKERVYGFVSAELVVIEPYVRCLFMTPALRNKKLADGLLRALLYYMLNRGFGRAFAALDGEVSGYLRHFGFEAAPGEDRLSLEIDPFFSKGCQGCKGEKAENIVDEAMLLKQL